MKKFKKFLAIAAILVICLNYFFPSYQIVVCAEGEEQTLEEQLFETVADQLSGLDLGKIEDVFMNLTENEFSIIGAASYKEKLNKILSGEFATSEKSVFSSVLNLIFDDILNFVPLLTTIVVVAIICGFLTNLKSDSSGSSVADIIHFVCYSIIITVVFSAVLSVLTSTGKVINTLQTQMEVTFPVLLTLMTAIGATTSVAIYQPAVALLSGSIMEIFSSVLMPIFIFTLVFNVISNLTSTVKLNKFTKFFQSSFKWIIGSIFTIFMAFLAVKGITASTYDGVSVRTAKYAIRSYVPILGGYLSEGFDVILSASVLIKNAIGASGLLIMFASIITPIVKIAVLILILKLAAGILEPLTDARISDFLYSVSKSLTMPIVMILGVAFKYLITTGLIMCTANFM
ncbi:MAG: stage III sporulation protein AE [Clostridia bacterium]|nr:stage III sporulation protein AE [Clostridia bacterium]